MTKPERTTPETDQFVEPFNARELLVTARRLERERDEARAERDETREDVALCHEAIEHALDLVAEWAKEHDDDNASASARVTQRRLNEAIGKAAPRLLYERPDGQQLFALAWKELRAERDALREALRTVLHEAGQAQGISDDTWDRARTLLGDKQ